MKTYVQQASPLGFEMSRPDKWGQHTVAQLQDAGSLLVEDGNHGEYRPLPHEFSALGVSFIRATDLGVGYVQFGSASRINDAARARIRKGIGAGGDVILSHKGTVGKIAFAPMDCEPFVCSPQTTFWRSLDQGAIDRRYLYYYLCSDDFRRQLDARKGETDMADYVSLTAQRELKVSLPPIDEQRSIGCILGALDDKIELNRRMNQTLESMARAIFRSWFVDFDPVVAKAAGRQPLGMSADAATLFTGEFCESELGAIPKGWTVESIGDRASKVQYGYTQSASEVAGWAEVLEDYRHSGWQSGLGSGTVLRLFREGLRNISSLPRRYPGGAHRRFHR
jgi:type I restriction enzyme S subunit